MKMTENDGRERRDDEHNGNHGRQPKRSERRTPINEGKRGRTLKKPMIVDVNSDDEKDG